MVDNEVQGGNLVGIYSAASL